jgi:isochorismate synthase EntC
MFHSNDKKTAFGIEPGAVYQLPSGHFAMIHGGCRNGVDLNVYLVNAKLMRAVPSSEMVLRAKFVNTRARLCWNAADWRRRVNDHAAEIAEEAARLERIELARATDISRARAIDAEHAAQKAANLRLRLAA